MALTPVCAAIADLLRPITGVISAPEAPPPNLPDSRMFLVYPNVGNSVANSHNSALCRDNVVVEYHMKNPADALAYGVAETTPVLDAAREALWRGFANGRFSGTVIGLHGVTTDTFGNMGWGDDATFGFRLVIDLSHGISFQP